MMDVENERVSSTSTQVKSTMLTLCENSSEHVATWNCQDCRKTFCDECDRVLHYSEEKKLHQREKIQQEPSRSALKAIENTTEKNIGLRSPKSGKKSTTIHTKKSLDCSARATKRIIKILVVGNAKCGKSSVIKRYANNEFKDQYKTTIGADFFRKVVQWDDKNICHLQLWDIAGQDRFVSMTRPYYRGAAAAVVLCDVTRPETLEATRQWKEELDDKLDTGENGIPVILIANKCDLVPTGEESILVGAKLAELSKELGFTKWFLTSAKKNTHIEDAMTFLLEQALSNIGVKTDNRPAEDASLGSKLSVDFDQLNEIQRMKTRKERCQT